LITTSIFSFTTQKFGNEPAENEDEFRINKSPKRGPDFQELRCAVADGATQASFSSLWAKLLVCRAAEYVPSKKRLRDILKDSEASWNVELLKKKLPWHAEEKAKLGAFSTLLWVSIRKNTDPSIPGGAWKAIAVGDSNLMVVRGQELLKVYPVERSQDFGNSPILLSTDPKKNQNVEYHLPLGEWLPGDQFLLCTDAVAHYLLKRFEENQNPLEEIDKKISTQENFQEFMEGWIQNLRNERAIRNDDSTLIWIKMIEQDELIGKQDANESTDSK
jgi:serine/threonine protein phosphatase PrpC